MTLDNEYPSFDLVKEEDLLPRLVELLSVADDMPKLQVGLINSASIIQ